MCHLQFCSNAVIKAIGLNQQFQHGMPMVKIKILIGVRSI
jgi:hypothetical protein